MKFKRKSSGVWLFRGDLDRSLMLTWIMFLKLLVGLVLWSEDKADLAGKKLKPAGSANSAD